MTEQELNRDLLIRIDERVKSVDEKIDRFERRGDDHERRIAKIEKSLTDRERLKQEFFKAQHDLNNVRQDVQIMKSTTGVHQSWLAKLWETFKTPALVLIGYLAISYANDADAKRTVHRPDHAPAAAAVPSIR